MRRSIVVAGVIAVALGAGGLGIARWRAHRADGRARPAGVDVARTLAFVEGWARRDRWDRFPESPSFAFYNAYATLALGGRIAPALRQRIVDALAASQAEDGGFRPASGAGAPHVVATLDALRALALVGGLDAVDRRRAVAFLVSLADPAGGYRGRPSDREASLGTTFHAVEALAILGALDRVDRAATVAYVERHREAGAGFALLPGRPSMPGGTFMAVRVLKRLGALAPDVARGATRYLLSTRYAGRLRTEKFTAPAQVDDVANVLAALRDLSALDAVDGREVERYLARLYVAENGGFGPEPGLGTTPPSTYQAVACLVALGRLPDPGSPRPTG